MSVLRYDPFGEVDRLTDQFFGRSARNLRMPMDAVRHGDHLELHFDVPGVAPDGIDVSVERNVLTVTAGRPWSPDESDEVVVHERIHGSASRQVLLGESLDPDRLDARYDQGVLTISIPVAEQAKARKVEIHTSAVQPLEVGSAS
jgi:HSP20 family protein